MKTSIYQCVFTGKFISTLLGGEFPNCHGSGDSEEASIMSLKLLLRVKRKNHDSHKV